MPRGLARSGLSRAALVALGAGTLAVACDDDDDDDASAIALYGAPVMSVVGPSSPEPGRPTPGPTAVRPPPEPSDSSDGDPRPIGGFAAMPTAPMSEGGASPGSEAPAGFGGMVGAKDAGVQDLPQGGTSSDAGLRETLDAAMGPDGGRPVLDAGGTEAGLEPGPAPDPAPLPPYGVPILR